MTTLTFITGNAAKAAQLGIHLQRPVTHHKLDLVEIQSLDLEEVVRDKAERAFAEIGTPVLVEDTSLKFTALGKLPGPLIKWFLTELGNDGLCKLLTDHPRKAQAEVLFGYHDGATCHLFSGSVEGSIALGPRGDQGFGWDPIFIPEGYTQTWAEMDAETQKLTSMRRIALAKLEAFLVATDTPAGS
jgi:non-canonical purine NTP pyrophosphatase (RdgB/HAM1 family)